MTSEDHEAVTIQTYDQHAAAWAAGHAPLVEEKFLQQFKTYLPKGSIIEIGAGGGRDAAQLAAAGYKYFGTDASAGMVQVARQNCPQLQFEQINVYDLAALDRRFDGFWARAVLLHIPKTRIDEALKAIAAATKPHGLGFITIKDGKKEEFEDRVKHGRHEKRLFVYWKKADFVKALKRNGFEVLEYEYKPVSDRTKWHCFFVQKQVGPHSYGYSSYK